MIFVVACALGGVRADVGDGGGIFGRVFRGVALAEGAVEVRLGRFTLEVCCRGSTPGAAVGAGDADALGSLASARNFPTEAALAGSRGYVPAPVFA